MLNLKKTAAAALALSSSMVFAGTMGPVCTPGNVTIPCERTAWDFGVQALYLRASGDADLGYNINAYLNNGVTTYHDFDADWGWGFRLEGSYHFNTGNDLTLNWLHYNKKTHFIHTVNFGGPVDVTQRTWLHPKFDTVNAEMGQHVDFGEMKDIRFHGGVQFAQIKGNASVSFNNAVAAYTQQKFRGFGPRAGLDMAYNFGGGFAVYGNSAVTLLVGRSTSYVNLPGTGIFKGKKVAVVPALEGKLGAKYTYAIAQGDLTLDAGWLFINYFNANHVVAVPGTESDFALNGPYLGLKWVGNV